MSLRIAVMETPPPAASGGVRWADLRIRVLASAVLIPLVVADVWLGGLWFELLLAAIGLAMAWEWCAMVHQGNRWQLALHAFAALSAAFIPVDAALPLTFLCILAAWLGSGLGVLRAGRFGRFWRWIGVPYVALPIVSLAILRSDATLGFEAVLWLFVVVWSADIGAYFAGRTIGGPRLAPAISPKKTWAGLAGALAAGGLAAGIVAMVAGLPPLWVLVALGAGMGLVEQIGDLFESAAKRSFGTKDSGRLIPGHGGVLDRVDGLAFAAVAAVTIGVLRGGLDSSAVGLLRW